MRFISPLLYGNFFIAVVIACLFFLCLFNLSRTPIVINLGFVNELAETLAVVNRIQSAPIIISKNVSNNNSDNEILDINSIMADIDHPTNYFVRKKIMTSRTRIKSIKPYKSVIGEIDLSVQDKKIDRLVGNLNIVDTLPLKKVTGDGNINNDEILKTYEQKFSVPKSLDLASLQSKLVDTFKKLNDIQLAEDEKRKNEEILQQNNEIAKNTQESDNVNPDENESLQSLDEVNTRLAKTHTLKPKSFKIENLNEFEKVENLEEATSIEYSNDSKPIVEETEKSLTTEEVKSVEIHTTDVQIKKNDYSSNDSNESNIGVSAQIDDFYVIDYSKNNIKKMDSQPVVISQMTGVSDRLAQVIEREKKNNKKAKNTSVQQASSPPTPQKPRVEDLIKTPEVAYEDTRKSKKSIPPETTSPSHLANISLKATHVRFGKGLMENVHTFQFVPAYNSQDYLFDRGEGHINLSRELNTKLATIPGKITIDNFVSTNLDVLLEEGDFGINVPVFFAKDFKKFLISKDANLPGGFVLIELDELVEDVSLETEEGKYLYLNDSFKTVDKTEATFVLIAGVEPGNILIKYLIGDQIAQKIIHVIEDEIFFENASFERGGLDIFDLIEEGLLIKKEKALDISNDKIKYFNYQTISQKESLYTYSIKTPYKSLGARKYLELAHLNEPIFLGYYEKTSLVVPNQEFINYILEAFGYDDFKTSCMIQLNLNNNPEEILYTGTSNYSQLGLEVKYLDGEGNLNNELTETTEKIFINGDRHGIVNVEIKYFDGKYDYIQTYCSLNTYLIEQL
ncbi:MAG: hypothetical protein A2381_09070 [Bdellovibrionales bacterium RIFOXYB1_FULL_37_110]|nr:MAG: hypothetical protein A2181_09260 [Bdellovibrionales bacterium RIFOXYA1_FULL_38_20]OFZ46421.1 MAG: hypothetical protein A2417_09170 [Bdellovibrionales bacterium RIFOXYC1_FULL_37_79]OFZ60985.1 MAG: hypothetical protein A2381_09070 [Bdellovibrionales bacterium RIFOXYB1_FULL_37_110]OFZ63729.1 MAG: hypothetical protein A2577_08190 [Bdellovibrionales bacterium RIFOXYD1_FULL_36_51]